METTILKLNSLWAAYRIDPVLRDINWHWQQNQQWAILGNNGSGKSALADVISNQLRPQRGDIQRAPFIDPAKDIVHLSFALQRQIIEHDIRFDDSETRTDAFDIGTTVKKIILQKHPETENFIPLAKRCGIEHILNRGIRFVSTGESRKALLARTLYHPPKLLILDNPFEGLDQASQHDLKNLINELLLTPLKILLLIKQIDEIPDNITHILHINNGEVIAKGTRQQVLTNLKQRHSSPNNTASENQPNSKKIPALPPLLKRDYQIPDNEPLFELQQVNVSYNEQIILNNINWRFDHGQHCAIIGPNGAGKSTLLSMLYGDNHKAYGQDIHLFGKPRGSGESVWEIKQKFGIVSTNLQLTNINRMRVAEVVASGLYDSVGLYNQCQGKEKAIALSWLRIMGLEDIAEKSYQQLSFGQQRLAMLARAMVKSPLILILDEPCIGLDQEHRQFILALIDKIAEQGNCQILYVSHTQGEMPHCINQQLTLIPASNGGYTANIIGD
jgi:molybdate transport system ATP-binding protein